MAESPARRSREEGPRSMVHGQWSTAANWNPEMTADISSQVAAARADRPIRPFYWSVWREVWENRSIYIAPLVVAVVQVFGLAISTIGIAERRKAVLLLDPAKQRASIEPPYDMTAMVMLATVFLVGVFYCLDALHGERRDRTVLFWKSLPISDLTSVLSKIFVPLVILPAIAFVLTVVVQIIMILMTGANLLVHGVSPASTWTRVPFLQNWFVLLYGLVALALWHAPIYSWLLMVSAWARKATFLWAVIPPLALIAFERITFGTSYVTAFFMNRLAGCGKHAFDFGDRKKPTIDSLSQLTPLHYLASPGLWLGLAVAAAFLFVAIRLRRAQGPL